MKKKKLDTRFPAPRIKKIMQSDEDVGKMALAVPLLVSKALERFLQDLCDRTYDITQTKGAKIITSAHLKQCVESFSVFDFLKEIVSKVHNLGDSSGGGDYQVVAKRKLADCEDDGDGESKRSKMYVTDSAAGRGRGRGRGRGSRATAGDKFEDDPDMHDMQAMMNLEGDEILESKDDAPVQNTEAPVRNFDLNLELDVDGNAASTSALGLDNAAAESVIVMTHGDHHGWPLGEMDSIATDATRLTGFNQHIEEDENYDEE